MKKTVNIEIDCAVCAQKCQDAICKLNGVNACNINFITQKPPVCLAVSVENTTFSADKLFLY